MRLVAMLSLLLAMFAVGCGGVKEIPADPNAQSGAELSPEEMLKMQEESMKKAMEAMDPNMAKKLDPSVKAEMEKDAGTVGGAGAEAEGGGEEKK